MIKRILHTCLPLLPWVIAISCLAWGLSHSRKGAQDVDTIANQSCDIPHDYCTPSIRALEQELKQAYRINDKYTELIGRDKQELIDTIQSHEQDRKEIVGALIECGEAVKTQRNSIIQCSQVLDECNENLEYCVLSFERQCGIVLP
ncbi:MAG: hypothetical protein ACXAC5_04485 [Promethearchaeota archaeon]|jgi:hypothetical protein